MRTSTVEQTANAELTCGCNRKCIERYFPPFKPLNSIPSIGCVLPPDRRAAWLEKSTAHQAASVCTVAACVASAMTSTTACYQVLTLRPCQDAFARPDGLGSIARVCIVILGWQESSGTSNASDLVPYAGKWCFSRGLPCGPRRMIPLKPGSDALSLVGPASRLAYC